MSDANKQKAEGMMDEAKGRAKQAAGDLTNNNDLKAEGQADEVEGRAKQASADAKKALDDVTK